MIGWRTPSKERAVPGKPDLGKYWPDTNATHFLEIPSAEIDMIKQINITSEDGMVRLKVPSLIWVDDKHASLSAEIIADFLSHKPDDPRINDNYLEIHSVELYPAGGGLYEDNNDGILLNASATQHIDVGHHNLTDNGRESASVIAAQVNGAGTHVVTLSSTPSQAFIDLWQLNNTVESSSEVHRIPCASTNFTLPTSDGDEQLALHIAVSYDASKIAVIRSSAANDGGDNPFVTGQESPDLPGVQLFDYTIPAFIPAFESQQQQQQQSPLSILVPSTALTVDSMLHKFAGYGRFHFFEPVDEIDADTLRRDAKEVFIACDGRSVFVFSTVRSWSLIHCIPLVTSPGLVDVEKSWDRATMLCGAKALINSLEGPLCVLITSNFILVLNLQTTSEVAYLAKGVTGGVFMVGNAAISPGGSLIAVGGSTLSLHTADGKLKLQELTIKKSSYGALSFLDRGCQLMVETFEDDVLIRDLINHVMISSKDKILLKASGRWLIAQIRIGYAVNQQDGLPQTIMKEVVLTMDRSNLTVRPLTTSVCEYEPGVGRYPTQESCDKLCREGIHGLTKRPQECTPQECTTPSGIHYKLQIRPRRLPYSNLVDAVLTTANSTLYQVIPFPYSAISHAFFLPCKSRFIIYNGFHLQIWELLQDPQEPGCRLMLMINIRYHESPSICFHGKIICLHQDPDWVGLDWDGPNPWFECSEEAFLSPENAWLSILSIPEILEMYENKSTSYRRALLDYVARLINNCPDPTEECPNFFFEILSECADREANIFLKDLLTYRGTQPTWIPKAIYPSEHKNPIRFVIEKAEVVAKYLPLVGILVNYCIRMAKQERNTLYLTPVLDALPKITEHHPDLALDAMREMAFIPLHHDDIPLTIVHALIRPAPTIRQYLRRIMSGTPRELPYWKADVSLSSFESFARGAVFQKQQLLPTKGARLDPSSIENFPYEIYVAPVEMLWRYQPLADKETSRVKAELGVKATTWWEALLGILVYKSKLKASRHVKTHAFRQEAFDNPAMLALLEYKWNTFASSNWLPRFIFQCLYYILVLTVTLLQVYSDQPENLKSAFVAIIAYSSVFLWLELIQFMKGWRSYLASPYDSLNVFVFALPMSASVTQLLQIADPGVSSSQSSRVFSFSILFIYLHLLFELRVFQDVCQFLTFLASVMRKIRIFSIFFVVAIFAFAHAFLHLSWAGADSTVVKQDDETVYPRNFAKALSATYFFMGGIYDSVSVKFMSDDVAFHIMMVLYFFFTIIIMLNVLIALISEAFINTDKSWRIALAQNRQHYIESAENMTFHIRGFRNTHNWFPREVYYTATPQQVREYNSKYSKEGIEAAAVITDATDNQSPPGTMSEMVTAATALKRTTSVDHRLQAMQQAFETSIEEMKGQSDRQQDTLHQLREQIEAQYGKMMELLQSQHTK
ncbi:hypothetical protein BGZ98_008572 [Dissophora globulifera]|nr:hypothetical protein BGZ98_008572 [Dissophora globulifera]